MALYRLFLRTVATPARIFGLGLFGLLTVVVAIVERNRDDLDPNAAAELVQSVGFGLLAPVIALVFASGVLGDLVDDGTLVYVWLRPVRRSLVIATAVGATLTVALPLAVVPLLIAAAILFADGATLVATGASVTLAIAAYTSAFVALGVRVRRALPWGLAYVFVWEGAVARAVRGAARLSIQAHASSLMARLSDAPLPRFASSTEAAVSVPLAIFVVAALLATYWLRRAEVA